MPEQTEEEARRAAQEKHDIEHPGPHGWSWPGPAPGVKIGLGDGEMMPGISGSTCLLSDGRAMRLDCRELIFML